MIAAHKSGTILRERYLLTNIVGQGGMGNVYRAEDLRLPGRLCAIKEVPRDTTISAEMQLQAQQQFLKEASILARLDHPNLPKVSDFFSEDDHDFLVMDFVPGKDLQQLLNESREAEQLLSEQTVLGWAEQIVDALSYLHRQDPPVLHRDIKPSNIKLTPDNRIKLVDFGLVKQLAPDDARTITIMQGRGTALYTPLEQYGGEGSFTDARTDVYAFGATLYHLMTDYSPPDAKTRFLQPTSLKSPRAVNPNITVRVSDALVWAMEMHPDERPETVDMFWQALLGRISRPLPANENTLSMRLGRGLKENWLPLLVFLSLFLLALLATIL